MERRRQTIFDSGAISDGVVLAGKYRLVSVLGRGGMGTVWRAQHLELGAPVAIKIIDPSIPSSEEAMRQCRNEARAAAALRSPHVVQVLDFGQDEATGSSFIVMEMLEGESLSNRLVRAGRLSPADTARVVTHVARALGRAHDAGIVHRDLKPANVFLVHNDDEETAKVLDFGTARMQRTGSLAESGPPTGPVIGTPYYMSPEHITGARVDHRADLWSLGIMACECLIGRRPFNAREIGQLVLQICTYPIPVPSQIAGPPPATLPPGIDAWFARATERDPSRRFQSARELAEELRRVCGVEPVAGTSARTITPLPSPPSSAPLAGSGHSATTRTEELTPSTAELTPRTAAQLASAMAVSTTAAMPHTAEMTDRTAAELASAMAGPATPPFPVTIPAPHSGSTGSLAPLPPGPSVRLPGPRRLAGMRGVLALGVLAGMGVLVWRVVSGVGGPPPRRPPTAVAPPAPASPAPPAPAPAPPGEGVAATRPEATAGPSAAAAGGKRETAHRRTKDRRGAHASRTASAGPPPPPVPATPPAPTARRGGPSPPVESVLDQRR